MTTLEAMQAWLAIWDQRQHQLQLRLEAWRDGWRACEITQADAYDAGFADGAMARKAMQHCQYDAVKAAQDETGRWGPGGRHHFADPRPGDYPGKGAAA